MSTRFDRDTSVTLNPAGSFDARIDRAWWIVRGPNGGYIAAILVRAMQTAVADHARTLRSLTVHYLRPPAEGPATVVTRIEREGRGLTTVTARLEQNGKLQALATAAFAKSRGGPKLAHAVMPEVAPPEQCPLREAAPTPLHEQFETRIAIGPKSFDPSEKERAALTGGWIRLADPRPIDAALLAAYTDAWPPAVFATKDFPPPMGGVPTVDLTVHIRTPLPVDVPVDDFVLVVFRTRQVHDGFLEEDGEIWSRDGQLLAHSRQLGVAV
ncbi:MAG: thioesterase family protein [Candidatus Binatia bacterium]|nr:thioesterase family protein [Candidatus Binatia bacterium]